MNPLDVSNVYKHAHLCLAAIRILEHRHRKPPSIEDVCETLSCSLEQGTFVLRKLKELGAVEIVEGAFGTRLFITDHLKIEALPKDVRESKLDEALKQFQSSRQKHSKKIAAIQADRKQKRKDLFADIEKKLKNQLDSDH